MNTFLSASCESIVSTMSRHAVLQPDLYSRYCRETKQRQALQSQVQELQGNVRVYCRIKPRLTEDESAVASPAASAAVRQIDEVTCSSVVTVAGRAHTKQFIFDKVFAPASQAKVFESVKPLLHSVLAGSHVLIMAYGQTGSGKESHHHTAAKRKSSTPLTAALTRTLVLHRCGAR